MYGSQCVLTRKRNIQLHKEEQAVITKAVILAAGRGTRFYPYTQYVAKEMLPIIDVPAIQLIIEEVKNAGIFDICVVSSPEKDSLNSFLKIFGKNNADLSITTVFQPCPDGTGSALLTAKDFCGNNSVIVLNGDDLFIDKNSSLTPTAQLKNRFERVKAPIIGGQFLPKEEISKYGTAIIRKCLGDLYLIDGIAEKTSPSNAPSRFASLGRYVATPELFELLEKIKPSQNGEYLLTDAFNDFAKNNTLYACEINGTRFDLGSKIGFLNATISSALERNDIRNEILSFLFPLS